MQWQNFFNDVFTWSFFTLVTLIAIVTVGTFWEEYLHERENKNRDK